ncbi:SDR family NAD(P)-dependent oxidoreductase [Reinekea thalattae]|uniref:SDR family NAD(P)-dependent oxidoreductase n=1 Tax=Reinekea thalattae TaxID=2593301 RepID=UPI00164FDE93|nr:SDR family NAD(P)-dependent oxidoreductase [Reinekea thalattae]
MRNVLITGAGKGLGRELARAFFDQGWQLFLVVRNEASQTELAEEFTTANILLSDVAKPDHELKLSAWLGDATLDVVINNAGAGSKGATLGEASAEQITSAFETNCIGVFATVKGAHKALLKSPSGMVVNISSRRGSLTMQANGAAKNSGCSYSYRISKAAQNMLTLCLADDLEDDGIRVAAIHPGRLLTDMASKDAHMTAQKSAQLISQLIINNKIKNKDYLCMETGTLAW